MILAFSAAAALALAAAGQAADEDVLARLDRVGPGAPAALVFELFPEGAGVRHRDGLVAIEDVKVGPECEADGEIRIAGGAVSEVELRGEGAILARCGAAMLEAITARMGPPDRVRSRGETPWRRSRTTVRMVRRGEDSALRSLYQRRLCGIGAARGVLGAAGDGGGGPAGAGQGWGGD
jgi:hypothetical protein